MPKNRIQPTEKQEKLTREGKEAPKHSERINWMEISDFNVKVQTVDTFNSSETKTMFPQLSASEKRLLKLFAKKGETTVYTLYAKVDTTFPRGTAESATKALSSKGLIKFIREEKHKPKNKMYYDISLSGLMLFLSAKENWSDFDVISDVARTHPKLIPLVFGNWEYFVNEGVRDEVIKRLKKLFSHEETARRLYFCSRGLLFPETSELSEEDAMRISDLVVGYEIAKYIIFQGLDPYWYNIYEFKIDGKPKINPDIKRWVNLLVGKEELKKYITQQLKQYRADFNERLYNIELWENLITNASKRLHFSRHTARKPLNRESEKRAYRIYRRLLED